MSDGYEYIIGRTFVVVCLTEDKVYGPFESELSAMQWAKQQHWYMGYMIRPISPINEKD